MIIEKKAFNGKIKTKAIEYFCVCLYFIAISAYQLGTGFDAMFVRVIFCVLIAIILLFNKKIIISETLKWSLFFWGYYFTSSIWASNMDDTLYYINNAIQIICVFLVFPIIIKNKLDVEKILKLLLVSLFYTAVLLIVRTPLENWGTERVGSVVGLHENTLGLRMAIGMIISLHFFHEQLKKNNKKSSLKYLMFIIIAAILVLFSGSKKALLLIVMGTGGYELLNSKGAKILPKLLIIIVIGVGLLFLIFNNDKLYAVIGRRLEIMYLTIMEGDSVSQKDTDGSLLERNFFIEQALELFYENPIIGYGGNNFKTRMREINYKHIAYSHNNFVELLATLGILGFIIYYAYWIYILLKLFININKKREEKLILMFFILIFILLVLDYGNVSYATEFNSIILCLSSLCLNKKNEKEEKNETL